LIKRIGNNDAAGAVELDAAGFAVIGLGLPHGAKRAEIDALLA
jgi:hypothetical protein